MSLRVLPLALMVLACAAVARELPPRPLVREATVVSGQASGYVFDNPQLLTQQLLWGLIHGVRLLGTTCQTGGHTVAAEAYIDWMEKQRPRLVAAERDLARHYFGQETASPDALSAALLLKPALDLAPDQLAAACESLPEALQKERYDLQKYYDKRRAAIEGGDPDFPGAVWVEPDEVRASVVVPEVKAQSEEVMPEKDGSNE